MFGAHFLRRPHGSLIVSYAFRSGHLGFQVIKPRAWHLLALFARARQGGSEAVSLIRKYRQGSLNTYRTLPSYSVWQWPGSIDRERLCRTAAGNEELHHGDLGIAGRRNDRCKVVKLVLVGFASPSLRRAASPAVAYTVARPHPSSHLISGFRGCMRDDLFTSARPCCRENPARRLVSGNGGQVPCDVNSCVSFSRPFSI